MERRGGVTKYLVGRGGKKDVSGPGWTLSPIRLPSHVDILTLSKLDRYMFGVGHCRMVLSISNNMKSLLMSFLSFRALAKMLARHASGTQLILSCYLYPHPHQRP